MYIQAVYFTELYTELAASSPDHKDELAKYWGSVGTSVLTLFQAITGGDDWARFCEVFRLVSQQQYTLNMSLFVLYIAFATLVMLNLVTGVFVEGAQKIAKEEKDLELVKQVRKLVTAIDSSGDGEISWDEFETSLGTKIMTDFLKSFEMDVNQARDIFVVLDQDHSGSITLDEFISASISLHGPVKLADTEVLRNRVDVGFKDLHHRLDVLNDVLTVQKPTKVVQPMTELPDAGAGLFTGLTSETEV
mmetsp:Transcript_68836/g.121647  ORF Transcript_68836/g.121647 Transcript_68836/m.121647 type:complete len:248 (-) Transcript_68836:109-852(-)